MLSEFSYSYASRYIYIYPKAPFIYRDYGEGVHYLPTLAVITEQYLWLSVKSTNLPDGSRCITVNLQCFTNPPPKPRQLRQGDMFHI